VLPLRKDSSLFSWFKKYLKARNLFGSNLKQTIEQVKPDIIVCNVYSFPIIDLIIRISSAAGIKTIIESHTKLSSTFISHKFKYNKVLYSLLRKWDMFIMSRLKSTSCVVALTEQDARDWKPYVKEVVVIPNFITIEPKAVKDYSAPRVISAGRYAYEKGYDMLLKAWAMVNKDYPDWQLHIFGDGDKSPYVQLSKQLGNIKSVFFHPSTANIAEEFSNSSIFVMSSRYEGFGLVLIEAMSCGLPCVSFDCPYGPHEIIYDGADGLLVENSNIKDLSEKLSLLISDINLRQQYGERARKNIKRYEQSTIMRKWINLFFE
jgi:glycosyltransferase involved in cell wall biosynthesis